MTLTPDKQYYRDLIRLAPPILLGNLLTFSVGFVDHFMTGALGDDAISGIYLANQVGMLLQFLTVGVESALGIIGAQCHGAADEHSRAKSTASAAIVGGIISFLLTFICIFAPNSVLSIFSERSKIIDTGAPFLRILAISFPLYTASRILVASARAAERAALALIAPATSFGVNLVLNLLLIYGTPVTPALGVLGAAISTLAARAVELTVSVIYTLRTSANDGISPSSFFNLDRSVSLAYLKCALPILGGQVVWAASNFFATALLGRINGGAAIAAVGVALSLGNLAYTLMNATSSAVGVIISKSVGSGMDKKKIMEYARTSELIFLLVGIVAGIGIVLLSHPFILLYRLTGDNAELASRLILVVSVSFVAISYSAASLFGIVKSGGDVLFTALCDLAFLALVTFPLGMVAYRLGANATLLLLALRAEHYLKCPVAWLKIRRGNWIKRLSRVQVDNSAKK